jgi:hypothetical protein
MNDWRYAVIAVCNVLAGCTIVALILIALSVVVTAW